MTEAEEIKLSLEKEKLRHEIRILKRPWYKNPTYIGPFSGVVIAVLGLYLTFINGVFDIKRERLENQKILLQLETDKLEKRRDSLNRQNNYYLKQNDSLKEQNLRLQSLYKTSVNELQQRLGQTKIDLHAKLDKVKAELRTISDKYEDEKFDLFRSLDKVNQLLQNDNDCKAAYSELNSVISKLEKLVKRSFSSDFSSDFR